MADQSGKTEQPTQRRLDKAREEGQFPAAREFVSALQFVIFLALLSAGGAHWFGQFRSTARELFVMAFARELRAEDLTHLAWQICWRHFLPLAVGGAAVVAATVMFRLLTTRFGLSLKKLTPDLGRLSPLSKLKELPRQNLPSLVQALVLLPVFLWAVYVVARAKIESFLTLPLAERGERLRFDRLLADGAVLEGQRGVPGVRSGGPVPPDAPATRKTCA